MCEIQAKAQEIISIYKAMTGRNAIPKNTPIEKTYQWRYIQKFLSNMDDIDWETTKKIAYFAIEYAKENQGSTIWSRGLWILTKNNIIEIAYEKAKDEYDHKVSELKRLKSSYSFAKNNSFDFSTCKVEGGFPNIVLWYEQSQISDTYIAMSESCKQTIRELDKEDLAMLPSREALSKRRVKCLIDKKMNNIVKSIMKEDYINILGDKR
jgi:hypothetical protein